MRISVCYSASMYVSTGLDTGYSEETTGVDSYGSKGY